MYCPHFNVHAHPYSHKHNRAAQSPKDGITVGVRKHLGSNWRGKITPSVCFKSSSVSEACRVTLRQQQEEHLKQ